MAMSQVIASEKTVRESKHDVQVVGHHTFEYEGAMIEMVAGRAPSKVMRIYAKAPSFIGTVRPPRKDRFLAAPTSISP